MLVESTQFNFGSITQITNLFESLPQYVIISGIILCYVIVIALIILSFRILKWLFYKTRKKHDSLDKYIEAKYANKNDKESDTYKNVEKELKKDMSELGLEIIPGKQKIINLGQKILEYRKKE